MITDSDHVLENSGIERLRFSGARSSILGTTESNPGLAWILGENVTVAGVDLRCTRLKPGQPTTVTWTKLERSPAPWPFAPLSSREVAVIEARASGAGATDWSASVRVEAGLLDPEDWVAELIGCDWQRVTDRRQLPLLRREFQLGAAPVQARLYVTAHGVFEAELNGHRVGDEALAPGWTSYHSRLRYRTFDVTEHLHVGTNVVGAWLGHGWYRGRIGYLGGRPDSYGSEIGLLAQLEILCVDGSRVIVATDREWTAQRSPLLMSELLEGETFDSRMQSAGWSSPGFDASQWLPVRVFDFDRSVLAAPIAPPIRSTDVLSAKSVVDKGDGRYVLDFGQNCAGRLALRLENAEPGTEIRLRHAEVLQEGELYTRPLRGATSLDTYICSGTEIEDWEPRFTMHGFRFAEVSGWPGQLHADSVVAKAYHSDLERIGWFSCSDARVNRLHENVVWGTRSNFVDIPTDCPQRDERLGWTGDIAVFAPTATYLYDCAGFLGSWLTDLAIEQKQFGTVPHYVPFVPFGRWGSPRPFAIWGDAAVLVPWSIYEAYGDPTILDRQYGSARAWVDQVASLLNDDIWDSGMQLGDWLDPTAPPDTPAVAKTDPYLVATAYFARSAMLMARFAQVLGRDSDMERYSELASRVGDGFRRRYVRSDGTMTSDAQTSYALAICFDLLSGDQRIGAGDRLAELVRGAEYKISTGFAGTPVICEALSSTGHIDEAYGLLLCEECPSWLYQVAMGATTIWERWDSMLPDGTVNPGQMTSFNHYALGAVADWLHRTVAGLGPEKPGYAAIRVAPRPGGGLTSAQAEHLTPHGRASVRWWLEPGELHVEVRVPSGSSAVIDLPGVAPSTVESGVHRIVAPFGSEA